MRSYVKIRNCKKKSKISLKHFKDYDDKGFVLIKNILDKKNILEIKKDLKNFLNKNKKSIKGLNFANKGSKIINTAHDLKKWKLLKKIQSDKKILKIASEILNCKIKEFGAEVFAKPAKIGLPSPVHQDNFYWNIKSNKGITLWIALDKSSRKNGSIFYYEKSQNLGLLPHVSSYAPGSSQKIMNKNVLKNFKKVYPKLNVGDILIHDCLVVHGSNKNLSKSNRMGLTLRFIPSNSKFNEKNKKKL